MSGTIVILNDMVDLGRPPDRNNLSGERVSMTLHVKIDGPNEYHLHHATNDRYDVEPGTYRVRAQWTTYHSNSIEVEVREGGKHYVRVAPTMFYGLTLIPLLGLVPQLVESIVPGTGMRAAIGQP